MVLATPLRQHAVITDLQVEDYIQIQDKAAAESMARLDDIKKDYFRELLGDMFDFRGLAYHQKRMLGICKEFPSGSVVGLSQKHNDILNALNEKVVPVGLKWQRLISGKPYEEICSEEFATRVQKGCEYFLAELETAYGDFLDKMKNLKLTEKVKSIKFKDILKKLNFKEIVKKIKTINIKETIRKIKTGEIVYPFVRKYLEGQISTARKALALAILTILPVKALWPFEIVFWSIYFYYVKKYKNEALEYDRKKLARIFKSEN
jgi:hypothetical protein